MLCYTHSPSVTLHMCRTLSAIFFVQPQCRQFSFFFTARTCSTLSYGTQFNFSSGFPYCTWNKSPGEKKKENCVLFSPGKKLRKAKFASMPQPLFEEGGRDLRRAARLALERRIDVRNVLREEGHCPRIDDLLPTDEQNITPYGTIFHYRSWRDFEMLVLGCIEADVLQLNVRIGVCFKICKNITSLHRSKFRVATKHCVNSSPMLQDVLNHVPIVYSFHRMVGLSWCYLDKTPQNHLENKLQSGGSRRRTESWSFTGIPAIISMKKSKTSFQICLKKF